MFDNLWFHDGHFRGSDSSFRKKESLFGAEVKTDYFDHEPLPIDGELVTQGSDWVISHSAEELGSLLVDKGEAGLKRFRGETSQSHPPSHYTPFLGGSTASEQCANTAVSIHQYRLWLWIGTQARTVVLPFRDRTGDEVHVGALGPATGEPGG